MIELTWIKLGVLILFVGLIIWFVILQFKISKSISPKASEQLPDESEVLGKELPIGFRFIKDGDIIEIIEEGINDCKSCIYSLNCLNGFKNGPLCSETYRVKY